MPTESVSQQQLFGLVLSVKRGEKPRGDVSDKILALVDTMSEKEIEKYASKPYEGFPDKKIEEQIRKLIRKIIKELNI